MCLVVQTVILETCRDFVLCLLKPFCSKRIYNSINQQEWSQLQLDGNSLKNNSRLTVLNVCWWYFIRGRRKGIASFCFIKLIFFQF